MACIDLDFFFLVGQVLSTLKYGRLKTLLLTDAWFYRSNREMHLVLRFMEVDWNIISRVELGEIAQLPFGREQV